jgi:RND family efflux transporter MFP subunit
MKQVKTFGWMIAASFILASCGESKKEGAAGINDKKAQLEKLKSEKIKNEEQIIKLQEELSKLDTASVNPAKIKLVATSTVALQKFAHYIELQGRVDAENISYISPRGMGGQVKAVLVKQGDAVRKGQLLLKLDDAITRQQIAATRQQLTGVNAQLALLKSIYERKNNLWKQGIGSEVDLLKSKTDVDAAESQLLVINQNVKLAQEQMNTSNVYSDVSGVADLVNIRVGETFSGQTPQGTPQIKIVNTSSLKAVGNLPENYLGTVTKGTAVVVELPDAHKTINTTVSFTGASIDLINRGFVVEAKLPTDPALKPNLIALIKIRDYNSENAIAIPLNTLQNDEKGKFVMVASSENGKLVARKRPVIIGMLNNDVLEIKSGLKPGEALITEGYAGLYEGQQLKTETK